MKQLYKKTSLLLILIIIIGGYKIYSDSLPLTPVQKQIGKLNLSIDPRIELLSVIQSLSFYPRIQRDNPYYNTIQTHFQAFKNSDAVLLTNKLSKIGFSYDAPIEFVLHLTQPNECKRSLAYSENSINRAEGYTNLNNYQKALHQFATKTDFDKFWKHNKAFYHQIIDACIPELSDIDYITTLERYLKLSNNSYNIIISPLAIGGYGPSLSREDGTTDFYACVPLNWGQSNEIPYLKKEDFQVYLWHEFCHSFINPETQKYTRMIEKSAILFNPIKDEMSKQAYTNWQTCVNEHIIRAINIRLTEIHIGRAKAEEILNNELKNHFIYIKPIIEKLKQYETLEKFKHATFLDFLPELLTIFETIPANSPTSITKDDFFSGPINQVIQAKKTAIIYPTNHSEKESLNKIKEYTEKIHQLFFKEGILIPDTTALKMDLSQYGLIIYGTVPSNLFLEKQKTHLPFQIKGQTIITDREYTGAGLKFITCLPNPQNNALGMLIYTATNNKDIPDINNVFHGPEDYVLSDSKNRIIKKGFYKKQYKWEF